MIEAGVKDVSITIDSEDFSIESILSNIIPIIDFFYSAYIYNNPDFGGSWIYADNVPDSDNIKVDYKGRINRTQIKFGKSFVHDSGLQELIIRLSRPDGYFVDFSIHDTICDLEDFLEPIDKYRKLRYPEDTPVEGDLSKFTKMENIDCEGNVIIYDSESENRNPIIFPGIFHLSSKKQNMPHLSLLIDNTGCGIYFNELPIEIYQNVKKCMSKENSKYKLSPII